MDKINRVLLFDDKVMVTALSIADCVNKGIEIHSLSTTASAAFGRAMAACLYLSCDLKNEEGKITMTLSGLGPLGKIVMLGGYGAKVKGYVQNPKTELPIREKDGKIDVGKAVGSEGILTVIKDLGLKEPYTGKCRLVSGEIAEDFAYYLTVSEGRPSAAALGVNMLKGKCISAGGIVIEPLPGCPDHVITVLEDICRNFSNISQTLTKKTPQEILEENFSHFEMKQLDPIVPQYVCECSREKCEKLIVALGREEAEDIIKTEGKIEISCSFCNANYCFLQQDVDALFYGGLQDGNSPR